MKGFTNCPKHGKSRLIRHHITPRSRGGKRGATSLVCEKCEKNYHNLFGVKTKDEILLELTEYWWKEAK